jgi:hypothetical protein
MGLVYHAETEMKRVGLHEKDADYNGKLYDAVMELMTVFAKQGHSGCSAQMVSDLFNKLSRYETLSPITNNREEWRDVTELMVTPDKDGRTLYQNRRDSRYFTEDFKLFWNVDNRPNWICRNVFNMPFRFYKANKKGEINA